MIIAAGVIAGFDHPERSIVNSSVTDKIESTLLQQIDHFQIFLQNDLQPAVANNTANPEQLQLLFLKARLLYKKFEWAAECFMGSTTRFVNGPPVQEVENADLLDQALAVARDPAGLQVMEEMIFPKYDRSRKSDLLHQMDMLTGSNKIYREFFSNLPLSDWRILDAAKLEVFRIITLGITGFDNPLTLNSMEESATCMESIKDIILNYAAGGEDDKLVSRMDLAINYLKKNPDFDSFDRAFFITEYANKISTGIARMEKRFGYPVQYNRMLRQEVKTLFDFDAFNRDAFSADPGNITTPRKIELGRKLFFDLSLSGTGTRSCASCHLPDKAFTDGLARNTLIHDSKTFLLRNTPSLLNAALQSNQFDDMRALTLEDQARTVIENKDEMDGSLRQIVKYLQQDKGYRKFFAAAYPQNKNRIIDSTEVLNALASYVRDLTKLNSRFDRYMRGDKAALTPVELKGFNLFMGKAKCASCHYMPLFNGMTPPKFDNSDAEVIGVPVSPLGSVIDPDLGWYNIIGVESYRHSFKTPTVRNAAQTAPYMHNGSYATLRQVMEFYNNGGGAGLGIKLANQTLPGAKLNLTGREIEEVIAFIKSLDSRS